MAAPISRKMSNIFKLILKCVLDPGYVIFAMAGLLLVELCIVIWVIGNIKYTEIDWIAYMQEVEGVVNGTYDYIQLKGDTGPLVYPAGFVYVFMALYYVTSQGQNIRLAQYIFAGFYLVNLLLVFNIYRKTRKVPPYVLAFMCLTSYRIHSIFILRLFNDPLAMICLYAAINLFLYDHWALGCVFYSMGVGIKMNVLLFAPALLFLLLMRHGIVKTGAYLFICASIQLLLGLPFLLENPFGYIIRSFELGRQFKFQWTVNWRFLPVEIFLDRKFQLVLLFLHLSALAIFFFTRWKRSSGGAKQILFTSKDLSPELSELKSNYIVLTLFTANLIGMSFSRSLHYQFYIWYYHSLHYLVWNTRLSVVFRLLLLGVVELCWNTYPSTELSSATLHVCHLILLLALWYSTGARSTAKNTAKLDKIH